MEEKLFELYWNVDDEDNYIAHVLDYDYSSTSFEYITSLYKIQKKLIEDGFVIIKSEFPYIHCCKIPVNKMEN